MIRTQQRGSHIRSRRWLSSNNIISSSILRVTSRWEFVSARRLSYINYFEWTVKMRKTECGCDGIFKDTNMISDSIEEASSLLSPYPQTASLHLECSALPPDGRLCHPQRWRYIRRFNINTKVHNRTPDPSFLACSRRERSQDVNSSLSIESLKSCPSWVARGVFE